MSLLRLIKNSSQAICRLRRAGAEGGIRTLARFNPSTPLAGEPLIATWVLLQVLRSAAYSVEREKWRREWDSNPRLLRVTGFQDRLLKPLGHLSLLISNSEANESIPYFEPYVNLKLRFLWAVFSEPQNRGGQPAGPRPKRPLEKTGSACSAGRFRFLI